MEKIVKHVIFIFPFLLKSYSLSEPSDLKDADGSFKNCGRLKIFDFRLMIFIQNFKEILSES